MFVMALFFAVLSLHNKYRNEWRLLSLMSLCLFILTTIYGKNDAELYFIRAVVTCVIAIGSLRCKSRLGFYHSLILLATLIAYGMSAYDISQGMHILIYNHYKAVIYGLVACQLITSYPTIRAGYSSFIKRYFTSVEYIQVGEK